MVSASASAPSSQEDFVRRNEQSLAELARGLRADAALMHRYEAHADPHSIAHSLFHKVRGFGWPADVPFNSLLVFPDPCELLGQASTADRCTDAALLSPLPSKPCVELRRVVIGASFASDSLETPLMCCLDELSGLGCTLEWVAYGQWLSELTNPSGPFCSHSNGCSVLLVQIFVVVMYPYNVIRDLIRIG